MHDFFFFVGEFFHFQNCFKQTYNYFYSYTTIFLVFKNLSLFIFNFSLSFIFAKNYFMSIVLVLLGFTLLVIGGEFLVKSSVALSFKFNISKMVIGMTVVSFATSAPELLVSLQAALSGSPAIALNNVIGSNIVNIGLVLGITALVSTIAVDASFYKLNWPAMVFFFFVLYYFLYNDNVLSTLEGWMLFIGIIVFLVILLKKAKTFDIVEEVDEALSVISNFK